MIPIAKRWMKREPRYRWTGNVPHATALRWIARSHALVVSSVMEGGANVICEAARIGTPVLASRVPGNVGMLGWNYPGHFPLGDHRALARLLLESSSNPATYERMKRGLRLRKHLFSPAAEQAALRKVVRESLQ
jgi:glycosyltransferase involved in cell wall biosynthesis